MPAQLSWGHDAVRACAKLVAAWMVASLLPAICTAQPAAPTSSPAPAVYEDESIPPATDDEPSPSPSASPSPAPAADVLGAAVTPLPAPKTDEEAATILATMDARLAEIKERMAARASAEGPPASRDPVAEALTALQDTLLAARQQVEAYRESLRTLAELSSAEYLAERSTKLEQYAKRAAELDQVRAEGPHFYWDEQLVEEQKAIAAEYEQVSNLLDGTTKQQTARQATLAQLPQREQEAAAALVAARNALAELLKAPAAPSSPEQPATPDATPSPVSASLRERARALELERHAWLVFQAALQVESIATEKKLIDVQMAAADSILPAQQGLARALGQYRTILESMAAQSEIKRVQQELDRSSTPADRAYWRLRLLLAQTQHDFTSRRGDIRKRYRERDRQNLLREISSNRLFYDRLRDRLARTSGDEKITAFRRLEDLIEKYERKLRQLARELDDSRRELDNLHVAEDASADQLEMARDDLRTAIQETKDAAVRQHFDLLLTELATKYRPQVEAAVLEVINTQTELVTRQQDTVRELSRLLDELRVHREKLFWSYTLARGPNVYQQGKTAVEQFRAGVWLHKLRGCRAEEFSAWKRAARTRLLLAGVVALLAIVIALIFRGKLVDAAERRELSISTEAVAKNTTEIPLTDRAYVQLARFTAGILPLGLPLGGLIGLAYADEGLPVRTGALLRAGLILALILVVSWVAIDRLFESGKARYRLIPCSNFVAAHYRFWLRALWFWTLIALPVYLFVARLELGPNIAQALYTLYAAGALAPVILLARDRPSVLRVVGRPFAQRHPRSLAAVARMYPLFVIFLVALLIVVLVGHGAFVGYLVRGSLQTAAALVVAVGLSQLLKEFVRKHGGTLETPPHAKKEEPPQDDDIDHFFREAESHEWGLILSTAATIGFAAIWAGTVLWIGAAWGLTWQNAERILNYEVLARGAAEPVTTSRIVGGLFIFVLSFKFSRILRAFLESQIYPAYANFNKAARATVNTLLHYTIVLIGLYLALHTLRLNFGALAVLLGGLGLGLGLGLQPLVINFVSGLVIFAERHVKVGDIVKVGDDTGEVSGISMRSTQVKLFDGVDLIIPNSEFVTSRVTNWTYRDTRLRGDIKLRVPYGVDVKKVRDILVDIANREPRVLAYPAPGCGFDFGESAYTYTLGSWFPAPPDRDAGILAMRYEIVRRFAEEGIEFAFPHQTLTFNGSELPVRIETSPTTPPAVAGGTNGEPNNPAAPSELAPPAKTTTNKP